MRKKLNYQGFSLIELMVVVAIIGILAAVGIPQYSKFQSKARTNEAKTSLSALFTTEKSFFTEFSEYTTSAKNLGFSVEGTNLRYVTGFTVGSACTGFTTAGGAPAETTTGNNSAGTASAPTTWLSALGIVVGTDATATILTGSTCSLTSFTAISVGDPRNSPGSIDASTADTWGIDSGKILTSLQVLN